MTAKNLVSWCTVLLLAVLTRPAEAHPGSGIVAAKDGSIYFVDTGEGVFKIGPDGPLHRIDGAPAFHWMTISDSPSLQGADLPTYPQGEFTAVGAMPTLILSSDVPVTATDDGTLFYAQPGADRLQLMRWSPAGSSVVHTTLPAETEDGALRWLNGIARGQDGSIYYSENSSVRRLAPDGKLATIATGISVPDCVRPPGYDDQLGPGLRELAVHADGRVFVAATACSALLVLSATGDVAVALRTEAPWSPTGVAIAEDTAYVLEYLHAVGDDRRVWTPRVRKLLPDGTSTIIAKVERN